MSEDEIRALLELNGVQFVNRSYGLCSTKAITLACLVKVVNEAIAKQKKKDQAH